MIAGGILGAAMLGMYVSDNPRQAVKMTQKVRKNAMGVVGDMWTR
jgi:hypothetical protein